MGRSSKKGPYVDPKLLKKIAALKPHGKETVKTWSRHSEISPEMIGYTFAVHNGKDFISVKIGEEMVGHRLGEFAATRKFIKHGGQIQRELEKKGGTPGTPAAVAPAATATATPSTKTEPTS